MFDIPNKDIIPYFKKGGRVSIINKSVVKKKKMKQKQTQKQIVNIYNTKPAQRKRVYKKTDDKKEPQRMPVYYTQPQYNQYLPAPTITMPTRLPQALERSSVLPTMTPETKLPTTTGQTKIPQILESPSIPTATEQTTGLKANAVIKRLIDKLILLNANQKAQKDAKNNELVDFISNSNNYVDEQQDAKHSVPLPRISYVDEPLPNYNYGRERLPPPPPPRPPQQETKDPSEFNEEDDYQEPQEQLTLISDLPNNKNYSKWIYEQLQRATINNGLYTITTTPKKGQQKFDKSGNIVKKGEPGYEQATRQKTRKELIDALNEYDRLKIN